MWLCLEKTGWDTLLIPETVKKTRGRCRQHTIHPSQTQAGWCDSARPPLRRRRLSVGTLPGWRRKRAREVVKHGAEAGPLSPPRSDCEDTGPCYLTTVYVFTRRKLARIYLGSQWSMSNSPLQSTWIKSTISASLLWNSRGSSLMERDKSSSWALVSPSSWDTWY